MTFNISEGLLLFVIAGPVIYWHYFIGGMIVAATIYYFCFENKIIRYFSVLLFATTISCYVIPVLVILFTWLTPVVAKT